MLTVRFKGSPGGKARFSIGTLRKNIIMAELSSFGKDKIRGIYVGHYIVQPGDHITNTVVWFSLTTKNGAVTKPSTAKISLDPGYRYRIAKIVDNYGLIFNDVQSNRKMPYVLPAETLVTINGKYGSYYKIKLSKTESAWISEKDIELLPLGYLPPQANIYGIKNSSGTEDFTRIYIAIDTKVPFKVDQVLYPTPALTLTFYGAHVDSGWTTYYLEEQNVKLLKINYLDEDVVSLHVDLNMNHYWGNSLFYEGGYLVWQIESPPKITLRGNQPLYGLTVFIDPGHGGSVKGAVSPSGIEEKEVNLDMSIALGEELQKAGAKVVYSRETDKDVSWTERFEAARKSGADIYLCMHNNSIPETWDPLKVQGTSTFFDYSGDKLLAKHLFSTLTNIGIKPCYYIYRHPYNNQPTNMVWVLVEAVFMSHPEDEILVSDKDFRKRIGHAVFVGIKNFLNESISDK